MKKLKEDLSSLVLNQPQQAGSHLGVCDAANAGARVALEIEIQDAPDSLGMESKEPPALLNKEIAYRLRYILILVWITAFQYGSIGPSVIYISTSFFAGGDADCEAEPDSEPCKHGAAELAYFEGLLKGIGHAVAWLFALTLGSLSDNTGRRPLFRTKSVLSMAPIIALLLHMSMGISLWYYLAIDTFYDAFDIHGVFLAFMSDVIPENHARAQAYAVLGVCTFAGTTPVLLASLLPASVAITIAMASAGVKLIYVYTYFPESSKECSSRTRPSFSLLSTTRQAVALFGRNSFIFRMASILVLSGLSLAGLWRCDTPILTGYLGVQKNHLVVFHLLWGVSMVFSLCCALQRIVRRFGEVGGLRISLACSTLYPLLFAACQEVWHVAVLVAVLGGPIILQYPIIAAIKSNLVGEDEQGLVQGALAGIRVVAMAIADVFFGWFFRVVTKNGTAPRLTTVWPLLASFCLSGLAFLIAVSLPSKPPPPPSKARNLDNKVKDDNNACSNFVG